MYVTEVLGRGGKASVLLRESYRQDGKVKNRTLANLSNLPAQAVEAVRRALNNEVLTAADDAFEIQRSRHHGHVQAVATAMERLGIKKLVASVPSRERDLVIAMIAARVLEPRSKLETTRWWHTTTLPEVLGVGDADEDELYAALDWLHTRQGYIEKKLARRHLTPDGLVLYDLSSTYMEGSKCSLAKRGYNRDKKRGKLQVNFGLLTDEDGRPVAVQVYEGNVSDSKTVSDQVRHVRERFGIEHVVFVGDRGMLTKAHIESFKESFDEKGGGVDWITALKSGAIRKLASEGALQLGLFDERNLFEMHSAAYPGERLVACRNPELQKRRAHKRQELLDATKRELDKIQVTIGNGRLSDMGQIGLRVGRIINKYKMAKHFALEIGDASLTYSVRSETVDAEAALDGVYVVRTSVPAEVMSAEDTVRSYKRLTRVERAFRSMKMVDLKVRPVYHRLAERVRAHIFVCMLAYYVEWHMRRAWASLLFDDEEDSSRTRDAVAPAQRSASAKRKASRRRTPDGLVVHSFQSLLGALSAVVKNACRRTGASAAEPLFDMTTHLDPLQARALQLIEAISPA